MGMFSEKGEVLNEIEMKMKIFFCQFATSGKRKIFLFLGEYFWDLNLQREHPAMQLEL